MQEQIIQLLNQTRSNDTNLISSAENSLTALAESPEFLPSLISVMSNSELPEIIRLSALIHMRIVIQHFWNSSVSTEVKELIKTSLADFIINWPSLHKRYMYHYVRSVINATISNGTLEWPDLPNYIFSLLSQGNENSFLSGLIIANSLCGCIKTLDNNFQDLNEWSVNFGTALIQILSSIFTQCENYEFLTMGFHCATRILISNAKFDYPSLFQSFFPLVNKSFMIVNFSDSEEYLNFSYNALKFSIQFTRKYLSALPPEITEHYFQIIQQMLTLNLPPKMKCYLLKLLNNIFENPNNWSLISGDIIGFLANFMMPLFVLTPDSIASLGSDPAEFISDVGISNDNFDDVRSSASTVIFLLFQNIKNELSTYEIVDAARLVAAQAFMEYASLSERPIESQIILFASFQMFSTISQYMNDLDPLLFTKFFTAIFPLFDAPEELARSAAFMLLSESSNVSAPPELIMKCIEHTVDGFPIARYYAVIAASRLLEKSKDIKQIQSHFANSPIIPVMFNSLFELSGRFHFSDIAKSISILMKIFRNQLLPIAMNVFTSLINFLTVSSESFETTLSIICDSLEFLIKMVESDEQARMVLAPTFCGEFFNVLQAVEEHKVFDLLVSTTMRLFEITPFSLSMWNAGAMLIEKIKQDHDISITDPLEILSIFIIKDNEFETREIMPIIITFCVDQMNQRMNDFYSWNLFASLATNIIMRLKTNSSLSSIQQMFQPLILMTIAQIESSYQGASSFDITGLVTLTNVLLLTNMDIVNQISSEKFNLVIDYWLNNPIIPHSAIVLITNFDKIASNKDTLLRAITSISTFIFTNIFPMDDYEDVSYFNDFDFDEIEDIEKLSVWFSFSQSLMGFSQLLQHISQNDQSLYSQFLNNFPEECHKKFAEIPIFAAQYDQRKK